MIIGIDARCLEWQRGGPARYLVNLLKLWPEYTNDHKFILYFQNYIPEDNFLKNRLFDLRLVNGPVLLKSRRIFTEQLLMNRHIKNDNVELYIAMWYTAPWFLKCPKLVVAAWDITYTTHPYQYKLSDRISLSIFSKHSCKKASGVITCSDFDAKQIENYYQIKPEKIHIVRFGPDKRFYNIHDEENGINIKEKYGLTKKYILSLGVIYSRRNVDVIIKAFEKICRGHQDIDLVVIGRNMTSPYVDIENMLLPLIKEGRAIYLKWIPEEELIQMYREAYYFICTSDSDGETILLKEAMSLGTPVITSPLLREAAGDAAIYIENPSDIDETVKVMETILSNNALRYEYSKKVLNWVKQFNWQSIIQKSIVFFESI